MRMWIDQLEQLESLSGVFMKAKNRLMKRMSLQKSGALDLAASKIKKADLR